MYCNINKDSIRECIFHSGMTNDVLDNETSSASLNDLVAGLRTSLNTLESSLSTLTDSVSANQASTTLDIIEISAGISSLSSSSHSSRQRTGQSTTSKLCHTLSMSTIPLEDGSLVIVTSWASQPGHTRLSTQTNRWISLRPSTVIADTPLR